MIRDSQALPIWQPLTSDFVARSNGRVYTPGSKASDRTTVGVRIDDEKPRDHQGTSSWKRFRELADMGKDGAKKRRLLLTTT